MTQIELESRLAQINADYGEKIAEISNAIKGHQVSIEIAHANHDKEVSHYKRLILGHEAQITSLKAQRQTEIAKVYLDFSQPYPEPL